MPGHVPEHWESSTGPSNWFEIRRPPAWNCETDSNIVNLTSSDGRISLTLHCIWLTHGIAELGRDSLPLEEIFPVRRDVNELPPLNIADENIGLQGEAVLGPDTPWWKRALARSEWRKWRIHAIRRESICVIAIFLQDDEFDPEADTIVRLVLESIEFAEPLADPPQTFAERVLGVARDRFSNLDCVLDDRLQLRLGDSTINLFNLYRSYAQIPDRFEEIVEPALDTLVEVQGWSESRVRPPLEDVRDRIMPMLYPESVWQEQFAEFVAQPWIAGMVILYVVDEHDAYWYIREDLLEEWGIDIDDLHDIALLNLDRYFDENSMEFTLTGEDEGPRLLLPHRSDAYNTARLLSVDFHSSMQSILGREFVVGVPNRDFFVAASLDSNEMINHIRKKVLDDFDRMDHPLSSRLLLVSSDGVSEYVDAIE